MSDAGHEPQSSVTAIGMTLDSVDPDAIADFWQEALGFTKRVGGAGGITLSDSGIGRPLNHMSIQKVPEAKAVKNRAHLDLFARDHAAEIARLVGLGATVISPADPTGPGHLGFMATILADPEGHEFCVVSRQPSA